MSDDARVSIRERFTRIEFVVAIIVIAITLLIFGTAIPRAWALKQRLSCQENLKTIGVALRMYESESKGEMYPRPKLRDCAGNIQPWSGALELTGFYPEYLTDLDLLVCPSYPAGKTALEVWDEGKTTNPRWKAVDGFSNNGKVEPCEMLAKPYYYYGWALSEETFKNYTRFDLRPPAGMEHMKYARTGKTYLYDSSIHDNLFQSAVLGLTAEMCDGAPFVPKETWEMAFPDGKPVELPLGRSISSLRLGAERIYISDIGNPAASRVAEAKVVVLNEELFDVPDNFYHGAGRINVLYLDGHVECRSWTPVEQGKFPLNKAGFILHDAVEGKLAAPPATGEGVR